MMIWKSQKKKELKNYMKELYALKDKDKNIVVSTENIEISNNEEEFREDSLGNVVGGVPYEVGKEIAQSTIDDNYLNYNGDESLDSEEKGKSR